MPDLDLADLRAKEGPLDRLRKSAAHDFIAGPPVYSADLRFALDRLTSLEEQARADGEVIKRVANLTVAGGDPLQDPAFAKYPAIADLVAKARARMSARGE